MGAGGGRLGSGGRLAGIGWHQRNRVLLRRAHVHDAEQRPGAAGDPLRVVALALDDLHYARAPLREAVLQTTPMIAQKARRRQKA